ncbi:hypothetical protein PISMIDRAFT_104387 [Pisolithus microcarpus 441]|uniref:Uncharacterized protein n=1 Tax=Pisolithus microcarpus 441 TaxID=765257 RepID=A0A0C9ZN50_9AGAM|nr:hypothetical protein PISMIDRAFT_104387 [Pisolithus microcarpus 441]
MVLQTIYASKPTARRVQPKARPRIKVILSANARAALKLNQYDKTEKFKKDLDDAWQSLDKVTKTLASKHHKSVQRVQNDLHLGHMKFRSKHSKISAWNAFCWKKGRTMNQSNENAAGSTSTLLDLVRENQMEYHELSTEDKNHLVEEFSEFRESKAIGVRVTTKSKVNDITHTLKAVKNEVCLSPHPPAISITYHPFSSSIISGHRPVSKPYCMQHAGQPIFRFEVLHLQLRALLTSWDL